MTDIELILTKVRAKWPYKDIESLYGLPKDTVHRIARKHGIIQRTYNTKKRRAEISAMKPGIIADILLDDRSMSEIADDWGLALATISRIGRAAGIKRKAGYKFRTKHKQPELKYRGLR